MFGKYTVNKQNSTHLVLIPERQQLPGLLKEILCWNFCKVRMVKQRCGPGGTVELCEPLIIESNQNRTKVLLTTQQKLTKRYVTAKIALNLFIKIQRSLTSWKGNFEVLFTRFSYLSILQEDACFPFEAHRAVQFAHRSFFQSIEDLFSFPRLVPVVLCLQ